MGNGTWGDMDYGRWYIMRDGSWEMVHLEGWFMGDVTLGEMVYEMVH